MTKQRCAYAVNTPAKNEAENIKRLASALIAQTERPSSWIVVDDGSTDDTASFVEELQVIHPWMSVLHAPPTSGKTRAEPIVRAFHQGLAELPDAADVIVKVDADISMEADFFARLMREFANDDHLGIASGACYELDRAGAWRQRHMTGPGVWGACRAYRRVCLDEILPLEQRMGWDTMDLVKAQLKGWGTRMLRELPFRHHRPEGAREGTSSSRWAAQGEAARYMGYRVSYLLLKTGFRAVHEPAALSILSGYVGAALRREAVSPDTEMRAYVRQQQGARQLPQRAKEALQRRNRLGSSRKGD